MVLSKIMPTPRFEPVRVSLVYRIGELTLFERTICGVADKRHFLTQPVARELPFVPGCEQEASFYFFPTYPVEQAPPVLFRKDGWLYYTPYVFRNFFVDMEKLGSFDEYLSKFSGKTRSTLRRKVKRFADACGGELSFKPFRHPGEMAEFLSVAMPLSKRTYQARLLNSGLPETDEFSRDLASRAAAGEVRGYLLMKAGRAAAYVLCYCRGGIATYDFVGFDPDLGELSPGAVLQYLLLESLFDDPDIAVFDFTEGEGSQKQLFATDNRLCAKTYVLRASLYNEASIRAHRALDRIVGRVGSMLDAVGMKSALRKFLRRSA